MSDSVFTCQPVALCGSSDAEPLRFERSSFVEKQQLDWHAEVVKRPFKVDKKYGRLLISDSWFTAESPPKFHANGVLSVLSREECTFKSGTRLQYVWLVLLNVFHQSLDAADCTRTRHARFEDGIFAIGIGEAAAVVIFPDILRGGLLG